MKFFDGKSFAVMAFMMTGGHCPAGERPGTERFIAVFYTGLGAALLLAGVLFGRNYGRAVLAGSAASDQVQQEGV